MEDFQTYTKNYEITSLLPPIQRSNVLTLNASFQIGPRKSPRPVQRSRLILIEGSRPVEHFVLIRLQIWCCFMRLSTAKDFSPPSILGPGSVFCLGKQRLEELQGRVGSPINYTNAHNQSGSYSSWLVIKTIPERM